jgi:hypothetical protein
MNWPVCPAKKQQQKKKSFWAILQGAEVKVKEVQESELMRG